MKAEKKVRTYTRKSKTGKTVVVKAHTAKYEAAKEKTKKGAGKEFEDRKKNSIVEKPEPEFEAPFTKEEFKEWYEGTGSTADKKVAKALRKQLGRSGYRKFEDEAIDNYTPRGHSKMFKRFSNELKGSSSKDTKASSAPKEPAAVAKHLASYQKELDRMQGRKDSGYKYVKTNNNNAMHPTGSRLEKVSDRIKYLEGQISSLEKGREALKQGKLDTAWKKLREFNGITEASIYGKSLVAKREKQRASEEYESFKKYADTGEGVYGKYIDGKKVSQREWNAYEKRHPSPIVTKRKSYSMQEYLKTLKKKGPSGIIPHSKSKAQGTPYELASATLKKSGLVLHQLKDHTAMEVYKAGDRKSLKNLIASVTYNGRAVNFGGHSEKENLKRYSPIILKALQKAGYSPKLINER